MKPHTHNSSTGHSGRKQHYDVAVVGAGPAGSVMAWSLARQGVRVLLLEKSRFPRDKVCGDFVEPRGLRILDQVGCLTQLEDASPLPISRVAMYLQGRCCYQGDIPFYGRSRDLPANGYIIPRDQLDHQIMQCARKAGAVVVEDTAVKSISITDNGVTLRARQGRHNRTYQAELVVGADGVNSIVARNAGLLAEDQRHIAVSQRGYIAGLTDTSGEAAFFFDKDYFPGYGWMFPLKGGMANIGVGILAETRKREGINVPRLFADFVAKLRVTHPACQDIHLTSPPKGGIVKTYGAAGPNYFQRGILIGDAGCFVDPMTGEGITPAMESALIGASVLKEALATSNFSAAFLARYETLFRNYFDPALSYNDLCACIMRNTHFADAWLNAVRRGCNIANSDPDFARITGATFGGMQVDPHAIISQVWSKTVIDLADRGVQSMFGLLSGNSQDLFSAFSDLMVWQSSWLSSLLDDPVWHLGWSADVARKWYKVFSHLPGAKTDPRQNGFTLTEQIPKLNITRLPQQQL
jgi:geranylgeranyl reductase family protein